MIRSMLIPLLLAISCISAAQYEIIDLHPKGAMISSAAYLSNDGTVYGGYVNSDWSGGVFIWKKKTGLKTYTDAKKVKDVENKTWQTDPLIIAGKRYEIDVEHFKSELQKYLQNKYGESVTIDFDDYYNPNDDLTAANLDLFAVGQYRIHLLTGELDDPYPEVTFTWDISNNTFKFVEGVIMPEAVNGVGQFVGMDKKNYNYVFFDGEKLHYINYDERIYGFDINNLGTVLLNGAYRKFAIWNHGKLTKIELPNIYQVSDVKQINDNNYILGKGSDAVTHQSRALVLIPIEQK